MYRLLYSALFYLLLPLVLLRMLWRSRRAPAYRRRWSERLGWRAVPAASRGGIWFHTVSVGETIACAPLIRFVLDALPGVPVTVTTMTPTGSERVRQLFGDQVFHCYLPWDLPAPMRRFTASLQPRLLVIMETELWPNLVYHADRSGARVVVVNARLSQRSADGYAKAGGLVRDMLGWVSMIAVQTEAEAARFRALGLAPERVTVTGSIKFDIQPPVSLQQEAAALRAQWGDGRPVWVAASTHAGEDGQCLDAHRALLARYPDALLVLVPRHPERFAQVATLCAGQGYAIARRSQNEPVGAGTQVYVGDTMGELMLLLAAGDLAFVGGSLVDNGGHNYLEPAALGKPVLSGPSRFNFLEISEQLLAAGAMRTVAGADELAAALVALFDDDVQRRAMGDAATAVVDANRGALGRVQDLLLAYWRSPPRER